MIIRTRIIASGIALALGGAAVFATSCAQPDLNCSSAHGTYAAEYTLTEGDPDSVCGQLVGDILGMQTYFQAGGPNGTPDYQSAKVAIRAASLGALVEYAEVRGVVTGDAAFYAANAVGWFTSGFPDNDDFCRAEDFEAAEVSLPDIEAIADDPGTPDVDETQPEQAAIEIRHRWSNARFLVSADAQGTQFEADLEIEQDGCRAEYHVVGLYPVVACESDAQCDDEQNGINPDFAVRCNVELGLCVLAEELPAYEDGT